MKSGRHFWADPSGGFSTPTASGAWSPRTEAAKRARETSLPKRRSMYFVEATIQMPAWQCRRLRETGDRYRLQWGTSANRLSARSGPVTPHSNAHTHTRMKPSRSSVAAYSSIAPCGSAHRRPAVLSPYLCTVSCVPLSRTARLRARSPQPISQGGGARNAHEPRSEFRKPFFSSFFAPDWHRAQPARCTS